ncbi:amino acid permease [Streptomyces sp. NPDC049585]|uniref:amino acid permease n=1 Tax=Streptomyces sp. NPDC049585 TaxID=3155154 RepID=UPI00341D0D71
MLGLGGVIGAGLFVGSGAGVALAGPGILISYAIAGTLALLVMRMLGEMSAADPTPGSFSVHAERAFGRWAGFTVGWLYWLMLVVVLSVEATGAAAIASGWLPAVPQWAWVLMFITFFTAANLASVKNFGELEFWAAALKVGAIVCFLGLGLLAVLGLLPGSSSPGLANLTGHGGFLPHGWGGVVAGVLAVTFSFGGLEVLTIAAAESEDPARAVGRAVRSAVWRILVFYIGSLAVVVTLLPWNDSEIGRSPYVAVLEHLGIPAAGQIMNVVVVVALLSAINANLYGASRMVFSLAERGEAPRALLAVNREGVPHRAVLASVGFGFASVVLNLLWPNTVFLYLLNTVGAVLLVVWLLVAASQLRLRRRMEQAGAERPAVRMWGFPYVTWLTLAGVAAVLVLMLTDADARVQVLCSAVASAVLAGIAWARDVVRRRRRTALAVSSPA